MARKFAHDDTPDALLDLLDYIEENTGLMGDDNPGHAQLSAGGRTVMITSDRPTFDRHSPVLDYINFNLRITNIGYKKSSFDGTRAYIEVKAE